MLAICNELAPWLELVDICHHDRIGPRRTPGQVSCSAGLRLNPRVDNSRKLLIFPLVRRYDHDQRAASGKESLEGIAWKMKSRFRSDDIGGMN